MMSEVEACLKVIKDLLRSELSKDKRDLARVSICLGALEASLTSKTDRCWTPELEVVEFRLDLVLIMLPLSTHP